MKINLLDRYPFFLILLPAFIVIHIESALPGQIQYRFVYDLLLIMFLLPFLLLLFFFIISRSCKKAALQSLAVLLFFYFFGEIKNAIDIRKPGTFWQGYSFLVPVLGIPVLYALYKIQRSKSLFRKSFIIINVTLVLFIVADVFIMLYNKGRFSKSSNPLQTNYQPCDTCVKPDIYYIIFDSYASSAELKEDFGYLNASFEDSLKSKGFRIIPNSASNYNVTIFSIGSVFNMDYYSDLDTSKIYRMRDLLPATRRVYHNQLFPLLEKENYKIFNHSIFDIKSHPATTPVFDIWDIRRLYRQYNFVYKAFLEMSYHLPPRLRYFFGEEEFYVKARQRDKLDSAILEQIIKTAELKTEKPKFVYAHFSIPHPPYTYDSLGRHVEPYPWGEHIDWKDSYLQQLVYSNKIMMKLVDSILANSKRPAAIVLQGDHGFRFFKKKYNHKEFLNLNAVYFSDRNYNQFSDSTTNVNTFRIIFNKYFRKEYSILPDQSFFIKFEL